MKMALDLDLMEAEAPVWAQAVVAVVQGSNNFGCPICTPERGQF